MPQAVEFDTMVRMANEGLPLAAIARCLGIVGYEARPLLDEALRLGKIFEMPAPDWPPTARRADRVPYKNPPTPQSWLRNINDELLALHCVKVFQLTPLQGSVFSLLLRHKEVTKEMIHSVIEHRRSQRGSKSEMEETELKMVDVVICHIRRKMKKFNDGEPPVHTLWGSGYYIPNSFKSKAVEYINSFDTE